MAYKIGEFWQELKRRNVLHVLTIYTGASLGILESADIFLRYFHFPDAFIYSIIITAISGFPLTFLSTWYLVSTPEGIKIRHKMARGMVGYDQAYLGGNAGMMDDFYGNDQFSGETGSTGNQQKKKYRRMIYRSTAILVIILSAVFFLFFSGHSIPFEECDRVVVADFDNHTGEDIFDHSLNTAFALSINQSRRINVVSRQRMFDALKRMKEQDLTHIDEQKAREIAVREGVDVCISPGISRVGSEYLLTAKLVRSESGEVMRSEILNADTREQIIERLDQLSRRIRRSLGDSRHQISLHGKPLPRVTTFSLEALKQFALGHEKLINLNYQDAITHYEHAIGIDSNFTAAKAALGTLLFEHFDKEQGQKWLEEAIDALDDLTDIERYEILAFYSAHVKGDLDKAIQFEKTVIELYPDVASHHNNLGFLYQIQSAYDKSIEEYKQALLIDPYFILSYHGINWIYSSVLVQMDSTLVWSKKMIEHAPQNPWGYLRLGCAYVGIDSLKKAEQAFLKARQLDPDNSMYHYNLAHLYRLMGDYESAIEVLEDFLEISPQITSTYYVLGVLYKLIGEDESAKKHFLRFRKQTEWWIEHAPENPLSFTYHGQVLTYLGDTLSGWEYGTKALEVDSSAKAYVNFAELLAVQNRKEEALDYLEKALEKGYRDLVWLKLSPDLYWLHGEKDFHQLIGRHFN